MEYEAHHKMQVHDDLDEGDDEHQVRQVLQVFIQIDSEIHERQELQMVLDDEEVRE